MASNEVAVMNPDIVDGKGPAIDAGIVPIVPQRPFAPQHKRCTTTQSQWPVTRVGGAMLGKMFVMNKTTQSEE